MSTILSPEDVEDLLNMMDENETPIQRETSESKDLDEIELLLTTRRRVNDAISKKKQSLQARLCLLDDAVSPLPRVGLRQRMARYFNEWVKKNGLAFVKWILVLIITYLVVLASFLVVARYSNLETSTTATLKMEQTDYELCRSATRLVVKDIDQFESVGEALSALYAEMPTAVRDTVIDRIGKVSSLDVLPEKLESVLGAVIVTDGIPRTFSDEPVEGLNSPSIITPTAADGDEPVSSDVVNKSDELRVESDETKELTASHSPLTTRRLRR